jgi:putative glutamine amidotransferase
VRPPLIAVSSYRLAPGNVPRWEGGAFAVPDTYVGAIRRAGAIPALLCPAGDVSAEDILEAFDGLLLVGGGDVDPRRYVGEPHPRVYGIDPDRDAFEIGLTLAADRMDLPTLAICRGVQVLNVAFGGSLLQHLPDVPGLLPHGIPGEDAGAVHPVKVSPGSRLDHAFGADRTTCSSHHHQGLDRLGEGLSAVAWADDGLVEAVERDEGWMLGVQWHPEETAADDPSQQRLFEALVERAGERAAA